MDLLDLIADETTTADPMTLTLLRETLKNAWSVGLDCNKEANEAAIILGGKVNRWDFILDELRDAMGDVASAEAAGDVSLLCKVRSRLQTCLAAARNRSVPCAELEDAEKQRRRLTSAIQDLRGTIRVFCRIRDMPTREMGSASSLQVVDASTVEVPGHGSFRFDGVFCPDAHGSQAEVFEECRDLVESALDGHNVTILAYGQTGAGKTYTMLGAEGQEGIAVRVISELFRLVDNNHRQVAVSASMVEMYNNRLIDLGMDAGYAPRETMHNGEIFETPVRDATELQEMLLRGLAQRAVGANAFNVVSSRSHFIFGIGVKTVNKETGETFHGKILLCDLGGAERLKRSDVSGDRQKEAIEINKSLTALGDVIQAITKKYTAVPYRNHRLTRLLQDSIGGSAKTVMFVNCSPAPSDLSETIMSLKYGARAGRIENRGFA
jgi:kinesin family protein C2/C3